MGTIKKNLMKQAMTESKIFDIKKTSYFEIIRSINHMINKVVDGNDCKYHYAISLKKDNHIFIVAGDVHHYITGGRKVSFITISTLNTFANEIYASKPKDILEEVEKRFKEFLDSVPESLEERVTKLEETVYGINKPIKKEEYENELVQKIEIVYYDEINFINTLKTLSESIKASIVRIMKKEYTGCKKRELILVKRKEKVLFAVYLYTKCCSNLAIDYTAEYENMGDIEDLVCFRSEKQWFSISNTKESMNNIVIELLQSFILKMYDKEYIPLEIARINNEDKYYNCIRVLRNAIEVDKKPIAIISCRNDNRLRMMIIEPKYHGKYKLCLMYPNSTEWDAYNTTFKEVADDIYSYILDETSEESI